MSASEILRKAAFAAVATPWVVSTGLRVSRFARRRGFGELIEALRESDRRPLPRFLRHPVWLAGAVERLLPLLPPRRFGPCLRRGLILLELWTRCGLRPTLHLGFRLQAPERDGHAWISATADDGSRLQASGPQDTTPVFDF